MSLDFDLKNIKDHESLRQPNGEVLPETFIVINYAGLITGIPNITAKNADDFYRRAHFWDTVIGPLQGTKAKPVDLSREAVQRHVGLATNGTPRSSTEFMAHLRKEGFRVVLERKRDALVEDVRRTLAKGPWAKPVEGRVYAVRFGPEGPTLTLQTKEGKWWPYRTPGLPAGVPADIAPADMDEGPEDPLPLGACALDITAVASHCRVVDIYMPDAAEFFR